MYSNYINGLNPCFDRIYFQLYLDRIDNLIFTKVSILVLIEFIFNLCKEIFHYKTSKVSILVLIEFIFNLDEMDLLDLNFTCLNPCFDRIYFQYKKTKWFFIFRKVSILVLIEFIFNL